MAALITALILTLLITQNEAARILAVFPIPSYSHQIVFRPFTQELARQGHSVTIITPDPAFAKGETPANITEIDVHDISYNKWEECYKVTSTGNSDLIDQMKVAGLLVNEIFEMQLNLDRVKKVIQKGNYDLLFLEACAQSAIGLSHVLKIPVIQISSFGATLFNMKSIGKPTHPILFPHNFSQRMYNMTKWEKLVALWKFYRFGRMFGEVEDAENQTVQRMFGPDVPSVRELLNNVDMMFLNIHPLWEGNHLVPPNVIYTNGMHQKPVQELPKDLKTFLDSSKNGVIYMSLGTNVKPSLLPPEKVQMLIKVFSQLPYDVLWKWDKEELSGRSENIRISKWLPQSDLLRHPKIKLFITQGGLQSIDEAITSGVPLLGFPMFADQWYNVEKIVHHKIGMELDMTSCTEEKLSDAIYTVIEDESYRRNVLGMKSLMADQPQRSLERAVWWTEYVLRHGGAKHLRAPTANITWSQYLELDLVLILLAILLSLLIVLVTLVFYLYRFFYTRQDWKKNKKNN